MAQSIEVLEANADLQKHINLVQKYLRILAVEALKRGEVHDASKMVSPEAETFAHYSTRLKDLTYGSPEYQECLKGLGPALKHHYENNRHHPEHYPEGIKGMNLVDLLECFSDWLAATKRHDDGDIYKSLEINRKRFNLSDDLVQIFKNTVSVLEDPSV